MTQIHELNTWVGGTPHLLSYPVYNFSPVGSKTAERCIKMLRTRSEELWYERKLDSMVWCEYSILIYDEWWRNLRERT